MKRQFYQDRLGKKHRENSKTKTVFSQADATDDSGDAAVAAPAPATFTVWASFLAPLNDMEYSSICTTKKLLTSNYWRLAAGARRQAAAKRVSDDEAKASLIAWLGQLEDDDEEPVQVPAETLEQLLAAFGTRESPSLFLYTTNTKLGPRTSATLGAKKASFCAPLCTENRTFCKDRLGTNIRKEPAENGGRSFSQGMISG